MLIREVILSEGYFSELITTVQDLLVRVAAKDIKEVSTEKFRKVLAKQGFITTIDELITAIDQSGYASSVDKDKIVPNNQLPDTVSTGEEEDEVDVAGMAGDQAIADIKSEL
jgi:hypothetical protein|tara:strand:- start:436 stop:771 length:336 start_codon:yes stop_codon:yes gene_type:complete